MIRILANSKKHIQRSGWVGFSSILVMTLAFFVVSIFAGIAYVSNLYIQFIEQKSNMIVFFEVGMDQTIVDELEVEWASNPLIKEVLYLSEEDAFTLYSRFTQRAQPEMYAGLVTKEDERLASSLEIKLYSLDDLYIVEDQISKDIEEKLELLKIIDPIDETSGVLGANSAELQTFRYKYSVDESEPPITLRVDVETLEELKDIMDWIRVFGLGILSILLLVVFIFIFLISEFRLYNQKEEIGVMQLVGGSLLFIRAPYILEGGFYGAMGAFFSTGTIYGLLYWIFELNKTAPEVVFMYRYFSSLNWPTLNLTEILVVAVMTVALGFLLGATSSFMSIRRYIR